MQVALLLLKAVSNLMLFDGTLNSPWLFCLKFANVAISTSIPSRGYGSSTWKTRKFQAFNSLQLRHVIEVVWAETIWIDCFGIRDRCSRKYRSEHESGSGWVVLWERMAILPRTMSCRGIYYLRMANEGVSLELLGAGQCSNASLSKNLKETEVIWQKPTIGTFDTTP